MKKIKRFLTMLIVLSLILSLASTAYAANDFNITFASSSMSLNKGDRKTMGATFKGDGIASINWTTSNSKVCTVAAENTSWVAGGNCSASVKVTAKSTGTANVTLYLQNSSGGELYSKSFKVTVTELGISFSSSSMSVNTSSSKSMSATFQGSDIAEISWSSSNTSVCTCFSGKTTWKSAGSACSTSVTVTGKSQGTAKITLYLKNSSGETLYSKSFSVSVKSSSNTTASSTNTIRAVSGGADTQTFYASTTGSASITLTQNATTLSYYKTLNHSKTGSKNGYYGYYKITVSNTTDNKISTKTWDGSKTYKLSLSKDKDYKITVAYDWAGTYYNQISALPSSYTMKSCGNPSWSVSKYTSGISSLY